MNSSDSVSRLRNIFGTILHPFRSSREAAATTTTSDDSSSTVSASPLGALSDPSKTPEAAILAQAGYQLYCDNVQDGIQRSTSLTSRTPIEFIHSFNALFAACETNGLLSFVSSVANDAQKKKSEICTSFVTWGMDHAEILDSAVGFFQDMNADFVRSSLKEEMEKYRSNKVFISEDKKIYIEFITEVLLLLYTAVYKPDYITLVHGDAQLLWLLIQRQLLNSKINEPEAKPRACFELYAVLTTKLRYRAQVREHLKACCEHKEKLKAAIETRDRQGSLRSYPKEVRTAFGFLLSVPKEERDAVSTLFLKSLG